VTEIQAKPYKTGQKGLSSTLENAAAEQERFGFVARSAE
jgi:hypothetical protein